MGRIAAICAALAAIACGSSDPPDGPQPLVEDPAIESGCIPDAPAAGSTRAKRIECVDELPSGLLVAGRVGDILIRNSEITLVVRSGDAGYTFPGSGAGGLIDAATNGGQDLLREILPFVEFNSIDPDEIVITEAGDDGPATVVIRGPAVPIALFEAAINTQAVPTIVETRYVLEPDTDHLFVSTRLFEDPESDDTPTVQVGDLFFFGGEAPTWVPGVGVPQGASAGELVATGGTTSSYGFVHPEETIQLLSIRDMTAALGPQRTVGSGLPVERYFIVGDGSISSVMDRAWALRSEPTGTAAGTAGPGDEITFFDSADRPFARAIAGDNGEFSAELPAGSYSAQVTTAGRETLSPTAFSIAAEQIATVDPPAGGSGRLALTVGDENGAPLPARVSISSLQGRRFEYTGDAGTIEIALAPGQYTLDVSRGMEYDAFTADPLVISDGATESVTATLTRVVDTTGWISLDTHLHSEMSIDSSVPLATRLATVAAEGVEVATSTDHDFVSDYGPYVEQLGLGDWVAYRNGVETTSLTWGHVNAWPLVPDYDVGGGGAFEWYGLAPGGVFSAIRDRGSEVVIQLNHPRLSPADFFNIIDFSPETGMAGQDPAPLGFPGADFNDFNFDAVEVANDISDDEFEAVLADWLGLVSFGHPAAATGASDSHDEGRFAGKARTFVFVGAGNDDPSSVDLDAVDDALRNRRAVVSQGAFVVAAVENPSTGLPAQPGELVDLSGETEATIHINVQAAPWLPLSRMRIFYGTDEATVLVLDEDDTAPVRVDRTIAIPLDTGDGFFVVVVDPVGTGQPVLDDPGPSFTNPLLFDRDGDGAWTGR